MDLLNLLATARDEDAFYVALAEGLRAEFGECRIEIVVASRDKPSPQFASLTDPLPRGEGKGYFSPGEKSARHEPDEGFPLAHDSTQSLPLIHQGLTLATLHLKAPLKLTKNQQKTLNDVAATIAAFRHLTALGIADSRVEAVSQVAANLAASPYLEEILQLLVHLTAQQFDYRVCTVRLLDEENQELVLRATQATVRAYRRKRAIKLGESIAGRVVQEKKTAMVRDVQADPDYIGHELAVEQGLRSMVCVPLTIQDRVVGVLTCYTHDVREFDATEIAALEAIARQAAVAIEHAKLQVRNTLMQEMHHRVKNNLQQVVSLLRLQMRHKHYKSIDEAITDSLSRILAIAAVHDLLSREDLDHVGIRSIAQSLVNHQLQSFIKPDKKIQFEVRGTDVRLNMTQATQIALVLNELIQNAVEHGFEIADEGDVHINVETIPEGVNVWVSNNGDPLPAGFDFQTSSHLGLQIVQNLVRGLGGQFVIEDRFKWAVAEVTFPRLASE